jgi:membrane protease YdiL (CAAX protease family)
VNTPYTSESPRHTDDATVTERRPRWLALPVVLLLVTVWVVLMTRFGNTDVYAVMGPYACVVTGVCIALSPRELLGAFACDMRGVLWGLGVGVVMTLLTYPLFSATVQLIPSLHAQVAGLYQFASTTSLAKALFWVGTLVIAEEVLFRGVLPRALQLWTAERSALVLSVLIYAGAQLGSGSFIIFLLALGCGIVWTVLRKYTDSLMPSLIAHGIWSPTVIVLFPVT